MQNVCRTHFWLSIRKCSFRSAQWQCTWGVSKWEGGGDGRVADPPIFSPAPPMKMEDHSLPPYRKLHGIAPDCKKIHGSSGFHHMVLPSMLEICNLHFLLFSNHRPGFPHFQSGAKSKLFIWKKKKRGSLCFLYLKHRGMKGKNCHHPNVARSYQGMFNVQMYMLSN